MSTDTLRYAAAAIREQNVAGRGFMDDTLLAVAEWLESEAKASDYRRDVKGVKTENPYALAVARTYLGGAK